MTATIRPDALRLDQLDRRRVLAASLPIVVPLAMTAAFSVSRDRLGDHWGYVAGFGLYWSACTALSFGLIGRRRLRALFEDRHPRVPRPTAVGLALLAWPAAGAIATYLIPSLGSATPAMVVTAVGVAGINALTEEILWRGVFITLWPEERFLGWIWPAVGFGAWHLAPQVIHASPMGAVPYALAATALGLSWGWVAFRTGSLRWVSASHVLTDASGVRNAVFFLGF